jgi:DNA-binding GntR family transcriptional regulator
MDRQLPRASTLADVTYHRLREDILLGYLRPNAPLVETELAERLEVSRTPVRESLQRLAKEGLITSKSRRWFVLEQTLEDIRNAYDIRAALEGYAARLATERATESQIDALFKALDSRGHAGPRPEDFVTSNELFHRLIVEAARNQRLSEETDRSRQFYFNTQVARMYSPDEFVTSHRQHEELAQAIRDRDGDTADRITRMHITQSLAIIEERWPGGWLERLDE